MSGEIFGHVMDVLIKAGALDVWYTPIYMKKNRPAVKITVICKEEDVSLFSKILFRETTTLGVRIYSVDRVVLPRKVVRVNTPYGNIRIKISGDTETEKAKPEYEDCRRAAQNFKVPLRKVYEAALKAYEERN